ncbi:transcriptional regulator [Brevibacterium atlanticum]|uniref:transcriptional regulator n=1 Tax=Brevibacterium atlanticum TaxID=2697563 RepID=UPI001422E96E|nr:transcriptional regulator [Brevibacterium atlanticum]
MTRLSSPDLMVLHAVRLLGFADFDAVAQRAGARDSEVIRVLSVAERKGWVQHAEFADLGGWSLTDAGRVENERLLATERQDADPNGIVQDVYRAFLPLNARLLKAVTDWQIRPSQADRFAPNDHADGVWDARILDELTTLNVLLAAQNERLTEILPRFADYASRFESALTRAKSGELDLIDKTDRDSCHRVWFELHEDLVATLGVDRGGEYISEADSEP